MTEPFAGTICAIPDGHFAGMRGASWHPEPACPPRHALALLRLSCWDMDGEPYTGELVVAAEVAEEVLRAFERIFAARFPVARMVPIDAYGGDDDVSMAANNSSGFNFRRIAGTDQLSQHASGLAVDINPVQNPWVRGDRVAPPRGRDYLDRSDVRPGMIVRPGPVVEAFDAIGWHWGGDWDDTKDYHHFSKNPR